MKNKLILSIAMSSSMCLNTTYASNTVDSTASPIQRQELHGGKCAAGKCGTSKAYATSELTHNPQCYLVRARDGKCGLSGKGVTAIAVGAGTCASGICGQ